MTITKTIPTKNGKAYLGPSFLHRKLENLIDIKESKVIYSEKNLNEAIDFSFNDDERGGIIIFSTEVNAVSQSENKIIDWLKKKTKSINNRLTVTSKIDKVAQDNNLVGWTVGHFLNGRYTSKNGVAYGEQSLSIELVGIDSNTLIKVATELCRAFEQEEVLVKDYSTGKISFVNGD